MRALLDSPSPTPWERALLITTLALLALPGCRETHHCEGANTRYQNGECMTLGDGGAGLDSGQDAGTDDASTSDDVGDDTLGPCAACGTGSVCFDGTVDAGHTTMHAPGCVQCVSDTDCDSVVLPLPDGGVVDAGTPLLGRAICEDYMCVRGCRNDADCETNGVCRPDHRCSAYPPYPSTDVVCSPCDTDRNCDATAGFLCLPFLYQNGGFSHQGHYCLRHAASCGATTAPLANTMAVSMPSIDGVAVTDATCAPATSCEALTDAAHRRVCTSASDTCGLDAVDDGICPATSFCTIRCSSANVCPDALPNCTGSPAACAP